ncbi:GNAT family N-acetyltransferase [Streptomyces sp. AC495_CC817]|uniref:GNAT family N-acetyltransferase n=1 Tax=Streptomyces sp. AC495_CC817 TaxID=2823900 RepID=UPI001C25E2F0|nr:GNAT family N-acetyltransferase [Streptomyces sp. AC495_CC817]
MARIEIRPLRAEDAGEVLTVQRAAFASEALIYGDPDQPALTQTREQLESELRDAVGYAAVLDGRIVGAVRARPLDGVLQIGRVAVAPDVQGEGVGSLLLDVIEGSTECTEAELFTGSLSAANLALYEARGYRETERVDQGDGTAQVFLRKPLNGARRADDASEG